MAAEPARRIQPSKFLDASLVPLERALQVRAEVLETEGAASEAAASVGDLIRDALAVELRALAAELHYW